MGGGVVNSLLQFWKKAYTYVKRMIKSSCIIPWWKMSLRSSYCSLIKDSRATETFWLQFPGCIIWAVSFGVAQSVAWRHLSTSRTSCCFFQDTMIILAFQKIIRKVFNEEQKFMKKKPSCWHSQSSFNRNLCAVTFCHGYHVQLAHWKVWLFEYFHTL